MYRRAFTLLEIIVTVMLLGIIIAFIFPDLSAESRRRSLVESADRLRSLIVMAHAEAMHSGLKYRIEFPGTPDPLDMHAEKEIAIPSKTLQPSVKRQSDPLNNPDAFGDFDALWKNLPILQEGTRCVAVLPGRPSFDISDSKPIAGPSISEEQATFVPLTFNPDGTCDWVTFVLTDIPPDTQKVEAKHVLNILNVIVDGRTGQAWLQRALRREEVEVMNKRGASPILHLDFTSSQLITEDNILEIHVVPGGAQGQRAPATPSAPPAGGTP